MASGRGKIVLMGSGELTATMVEVHKYLLSQLEGSPKAVFLDTPAGFQLNVDQISKKAKEYFSHHVKAPLQVASLKSTDTLSEFEAKQAYRQIENADYILIGPGSPTYAVRQLVQTPVPEILVNRINAGACLVLASAAALTVGEQTLPVYEIYKVGEAPHWIQGLNILSHFGINMVVIPHWNNAEGGTHDTRFCFMGAPRFQNLESMLPEKTMFLGLDEHTACIIDLEQEMIHVKGIGNVVLRQNGEEMVFGKGAEVPMVTLQQNLSQKHVKTLKPEKTRKPESTGTKENIFWTKVRGLEKDFRTGLESHDIKMITQSIMELDSIIWQVQSDMESEEDIVQAREVLRDLLALLGVKLATLPRSNKEALAPLVEKILQARARYKQEKKWAEADTLRDILLEVNITVEDTKDGHRWRVK